MCRRSSPGLYARYSANSWLKPKSGERCSPATKPSTTVLAIKSRPLMEASVAGSRKRCSMGYLWGSCTSMGDQSTEQFLLIDASLFSRRGLSFEDPLQDVVLFQPVRLRVEIQQNPVPQNRSVQRPNVLIGHVISIFHQRPRFGG